MSASSNPLAGIPASFYASPFSGVSSSSTGSSILGYSQPAATTTQPTTSAYSGGISSLGGGGLLAEMMQMMMEMMTLMLGSLGNQGGQQPQQPVYAAPAPAPTPAPTDPSLPTTGTVSGALPPGYTPISGGTATGTGLLQPPTKIAIPPGVLSGGTYTAPDTWQGGPNGWQPAQIPNGLVPVNVPHLPGESSYGFYLPNGTPVSVETYTTGPMTTLGDGSQVPLGTIEQ